jgi:hypothetical protein
VDTGASSTGDADRRGHRRSARPTRTDRRIERLVASLVEGRDIPPEEAVDLLTTGAPAQAAERFAAKADAGATGLVLGTIGDDWHASGS